MCVAKVQIMYYDKSVIIVIKQSLILANRDKRKKKTKYVYT